MNNFKTNLEHDCGIALVRLRKPLSYYQKKYGDAAWGLRKLYLLMEKQRNRGQDGAGIAVVKFNPPPGQEFLLRTRSAKHNAISRIFDTVIEDLHAVDSATMSAMTDAQLKEKFSFLGEAYLGHLRYGTHGGNDEKHCQPYLCANKIPSKNFAIAGNFNMTNSQQLFAQLVNLGIAPTAKTDTKVILDRLDYCLSREHLYLTEQIDTNLSLEAPENHELIKMVSRDLDPVRVLRSAARDWDGGYVFGCMLGNGDVFVWRDPVGIRPAYVYIDDEVVAVASERITLSSIFEVPLKKIQPINPGYTLVIKHTGRMYEKQFREPLERKECMFERIYFSRVNDPDIYQERKNLGKELAPRVLKELGNDIENAVFSYVPNSGEAAYLGLVEEINRLSREQQATTLWSNIKNNTITQSAIKKILNSSVRAERLIYKDQLLRTFITHDSARNNLIAHVYDITKGIVKPSDTLVVVDDSIVRGATLREALIRQLSTLNPKKIIIVSSCPPIMYPDCYGIDMSQINRFIAFQAAIEIIKERKEETLLDVINELCLKQNNKALEHIQNYVQKMYTSISHTALEQKIAQLVTPQNLTWKGDIKVIYQTIEGLHKAIPHHKGDWFFTGNYPTQGGYQVVNRSYINQYRGHDIRAY